MLKIYGADLSSPANKVRFVANYLNLEYEYVFVKIQHGEHQTEEYKKLHPAGKIPSIDDNGFTLFESNAIIKYLARKQKSDLYPTDLRDQAIVDQWIDYVGYHINTAMGRVIFNRVFYRFAKVEQDQNSLADGLKFLDRFLPVVEKQLQNNKFLAGEKLSLADFCFLAALDPAEVAQIDLKPYAKILAFCKEYRQKDFYQKCYSEYGLPIKERLAKL